MAFSGIVLQYTDAPGRKCRQAARAAQQCAMLTVLQPSGGLDCGAADHWMSCRGF